MKSKAKKPFVPADRGETVRREIIALLKEESLTAREISEQVGIPEKDVVEHLEHVRIALHGGLEVTPAQCMGCGFLFRKRERLKAPGRCPVCRGEHITKPTFSIEE